MADEEQKKDNISDILRKAGLFGIGVVVLTTEKVEDFAKEMVEKGELNSEEGKKFVKEFLTEKDKQIKEIDQKINQKIKEILQTEASKDIATTKKDIEDIKTRLDKLEKWKQG